MKQARARLTRAIILDAGAEVFEAHGFAATNLQAVIDRTGLTKGALYGHFSSKSALALAVVDSFETSWREMTADARLSTRPALQTLHWLTLELTRRMAEDIRFMAGLRLSMEAARPSRTEEPHLAELRGLVTSLVTLSQEQGDLPPEHHPDLIGRLLIALVLGTRESCSGGAGDDALGLLRSMWDTVLPALRNVPVRPPVPR
ncbi:MAG TPA: helix-turn-helix domain-containing protein [Streptomyces sp.]|nr:helix-turn-helix domain-containing protein [Streptomyces sp.]